MAEQQTPAQPQQPSQANNQPHIRINNQYVKDLSFENPNAPEVLLKTPQDTRLAVSVDVDARQLEGTTFEVVLKFDIRAKSGEKTVFIVDLAYAGVFTLVNLPEDQLRLACLIECPRLIFPFARRIIADTTRDGGFMPLQLDPIDFLRLYQQNMQRVPAGGAEAAAPAMA